MLQINKLRADHVIDFAAEELKKYLRMMMPSCGDIAIGYAPEATEGFRLGLLEDFGLPNEAEDPVLDDVVHIETGTSGGILAGSNMRSVLFAVYRLLKENGCRWLYPGIDGEYIPLKELEPVQYHKMADHRFRGQCNEGAEYQQCMMETIDFYAKLEMNVYMIEFDNPYTYYATYYDHVFNENNRPPEPVSFDQVMQWKRQCEVEIAKRGLQFHDMGHGWTAEPFGISSTEGWKAVENPDIPEETRECLALLNGKRELYGGVALNTNLCMSKPKVRSTVADSIVRYAETHQNVDYIHVWLADGSRNHCECEECQKMRPSDFYLEIMNELDEKLTAKQLDNRIVFIVYVDTLFAPEKVHIQNPKRFCMLYAPITRSYSSSLTKDSVIPNAPAYERNTWKSPVSAEENIAFLKDWQKDWNGPCFSYEYHFWRHQYYDPSGLYISRRIYEDIMALKDYGIDGFVEDGSQRSFFPNGLAMVVFAEALLNRECDYEAIKEDYFHHIYGDQKEIVEKYLKGLHDTFDFSYLSGERSIDKEKGQYYNPEMAEKLKEAEKIAAEARVYFEQHLAMPTRSQTVSMRLLLRHAEYCESIAEAAAEKAIGNDEKSRELGEAFVERFGRYEFEIERYFDHGMAMRFIKGILC